tara:strand:+ start:225 stop:887 length:663 start_codon:yes stop_codon:yes gene_type:complete
MTLENWYGANNEAEWWHRNPQGKVGMRGARKLWEMFPSYMNWGIVNHMLGATPRTPGLDAAIKGDPYSGGNWLTQFGSNTGTYDLGNYQTTRSTGRSPEDTLSALVGSRLHIGAGVRSQIQKDIDANRMKEMMVNTQEAEARRLDMEQAMWNKEIEAIKSVPVPYNKPAVIAGASGRFQQQGSATASRRRGKSVKETFGRRGQQFAMNIPSGTQGQLNIA